jgi:tripartite-type tricarboxylate transporter receptor subunit TctC
VAPAGTPKPIIELLQKEVARMVALPDVKQKLGTLGFTPVGGTSEAYEAQIKSDLETWSRVVKDLGITVQ